jgi:hypothetical protein
MPEDTYNPAYSQIQPFNIRKDGTTKTPAYSHLNPQAYATLEELSLKQPGYKSWGSLIDISKYIPSPGILAARTASEKVWHFLANPQSVDFSRTVNWTEQPTLGSANTMLNYGHTSGGTITLNDILMPCNCVPKNLQEYMERLQNLMVPARKTVSQQTPNAPSNNDYRAPYLALVWGANVRYPVVIKDIKWKETHWYKGIPTYINVSITLQQLPMPLKPNAFGKTGSELDKQFGNTLRENRQSKIEAAEQELQGFYNRDGIFAIQNPRVRELMAQLAKDKSLRKVNDLSSGNGVIDAVTGISLLKTLVGDDARQSRRDFKRELDRNIKYLDSQLGNLRFSGADLQKDLNAAVDFYGSMFKDVKPPNLTGLSGRASVEATKNYYKQLFDHQQQQEKSKITNR